MQGQRRLQVTSSGHPSPGRASGRRAGPALRRAVRPPPGLEMAGVSCAPTCGASGLGRVGVSVQTAAIRAPCRLPTIPSSCSGTDKNDRARSRFDAAHELAHLVLLGGQIWGVKEVEKQAHTFAAALIVPADEIASLLMRARALGCMSESTYLTAIKAASARGWRRVEPVPLGAPEHPYHLLNFLASTASGTAHKQLPSRSSLRSRQSRNSVGHQRSLTAITRRYCRRREAHPPDRQPVGVAGRSSSACSETQRLGDERRSASGPRQQSVVTPTGLNGCTSRTASATAA